MTRSLRFALFSAVIAAFTVFAAPRTAAAAPRGDYCDDLQTTCENIESECDYECGWTCTDEISCIQCNNACICEELWCLYDDYCFTDYPMLCA